MFKVESNIEQFKQNIKGTLQQLVDVDKVLREAALDTVVLISDRVQQRGLKTDGSPIKSDKNSVPAHRNKSGKLFSKRKKTTTRVLLSTPYSEEYAKRRVKKGLQIAHIDETYSGDMMGDFLAVPEGNTAYVVGFRGQLSSDKADWNERRFGTIFQLSESEANLIFKNVVSKRINEIFNRPSK